jgi:hypothetical protein
MPCLEPLKSRDLAKINRPAPLGFGCLGAVNEGYYVRWMKALLNRVPVWTTCAILGADALCLLMAPGEPAVFACFVVVAGSSLEGGSDVRTRSPRSLFIALVVTMWVAAAWSASHVHAPVSFLQWIGRAIDAGTAIWLIALTVQLVRLISSPAQPAAERGEAEPQQFLPPHGLV